LLEHMKEATPVGAKDELPLRSAYESLSIEELARLKGVKPVTSLADMACEGIFESDEEMEEFIAFTYKCRREGLA
jgi:hypothetical protein